MLDCVRLSETGFPRIGFKESAMEMSLTQSVFPSSVIKTRYVSGFQMMEGLYYANTSVPRHSHEQAVFCIALKGRCAEIYGSEVREYQPLTVQFLPPNETHSLEISSLEVRAFSVEVAPQWLDRTRENLCWSITRCTLREA